MHVFSTSFPVQSFKNCTFLASKSSNAGTTCFNEYFSFIYPSGLPRWLMSIIDFAPWSKQYWIEGRVLVILVGSLTFPFFSGTLKSVLMRILFPLMRWGMLSIASFLDSILKIYN
jgi:hypothetical protein